jgi:hypothetical protein
VGLSVHYRYLDAARPDGGLGDDLAAIGVAEVTLMIYNANADRVVAVAGPIMKRYPAIGFSIAQTVESILSPAESYANRTRSAFLGEMRRLWSGLDHANFKGLLVQSWAEYEEMQP